jgi:hypothetical protein
MTNKVYKAIILISGASIIYFGAVFLRQGIVRLIG